MRYAIFGDMHGSELKDLEKALEIESPDVLICTGDFDQVRTIRQYMELEQKYLEAGKNVITVPGNHDHALLIGLAIESRVLSMQGKKHAEMIAELNKDKDAKDYLARLVNLEDPKSRVEKRIFLDEKLFGQDYLTAILHGAYAGEYSGISSFPEGMRSMWKRINSKRERRKNFEIMASEGVKIMIRGHDHTPIHFTYDLKGRMKVFSYDSKHKIISKDMIHIINHGALFDGYFAIMDTISPGTEEPVLEYHRLSSTKPHYSLLTFDSPMGKMK